MEINSCFNVFHVGCKKSVLVIIFFSFFLQRIFKLKFKQTNENNFVINFIKLRYIHTTMCCLNNLDYPWYIHYFNPINIITLSYKFINADKAVDKNKTTKFISRPGHIEVNSSTSCTGKLLEFVFVQRIYQKIFLDHKTYCDL